MVLVENWPFFELFFLGNIGQGNVLSYILERKYNLRYKKRKFKKAKNCHFSKGVSLWFWSKICHFPTFFLLGNIGQGNVFYGIGERKKKTLLRL